MNFLIYNRVSVTLIVASTFSVIALVFGEMKPNGKTTTESNKHTSGLLGVHNAGPPSVLVTVAYTLGNRSITRDVKLHANNAEKFDIPIDATSNGIRIEEYEFAFLVPIAGRVTIPHRRVILDKGFSSPTQECYRTYGKHYAMKYDVIPCSGVIDYAA